MPQREKMQTAPPPSGFAPLGQAVMESFAEGIVVFDPYGRVIYANQRARKVLDGLGDPAFLRGGALRERLVGLGGRARALKQGSLELGEAVFLPDGDDAKTLAERERRAMLRTPQGNPSQLAQTAPKVRINPPHPRPTAAAYRHPTDGSSAPPASRAPS